MSTPTQQSLFDAAPPLAGAPAFIERQFPVARLSMESYKERSAKQSQTLTGLGKWWGRKPLILVRATILGLLLPATDDPIRDREVFLMLLTMDEAGLSRRRSKSIPGVRLLAELSHMPPSQRRQFIDPSATSDAPRLRAKLSREERSELQRLVFARMTYAEKLEYCDRPEQIDGPMPDDWAEINAHLGTDAATLPQLVAQLGQQRFGHIPRVGDAFCGGGSVPFEAARLGCDAYGSDLNPVAALLTWAGLNIIGGGSEVEAEVKRTQKEVFIAVDQQITAWGIEHNEQGWRADAYLYCVEVMDPESGWRVPLAPSWVVGEKPSTIAKLEPDFENQRYNIEIHQNVSSEEMAAAKASGTVRESRVVHAEGENPVPLEVVRINLRSWENSDLAPRINDVFQERLYCIRWVETLYDEAGEKIGERRHYRAPTEADLERDKQALHLLKSHFADWQAKGYIPNRQIEPGSETSRLLRERGWTHWHHLFAPRQLLQLGLFFQALDTLSPQLTTQSHVASLLGLSRSEDYNSKLCRWHTRSVGDKSEQTFSNQALNTLYNFAVRSLIAIDDSFLMNLRTAPIAGEGFVDVTDARDVTESCDIWMTDPPYADAISYHELSEYFLAWYEKQIPKLFPEWYTDSRRSLAVRGNDERFRQSMVECYRNLAEHMPNDGFQVVMFTHQDSEVWADLTMILWAAGLRVSAAWCIATETESSLKQGNYVQGTVLLVLRKRTKAEPVFLDEITHRVELEVRRQLDEMLRIEDASEPNFADADYQLAAYAAALRVLTERPIEELDPAREIARERKRGEVSPVERLIRNAVKIACDHLVPTGLDRELWKSLAPMERFYLKGLEVESHGEHRSGVYQELARGFGAAEYTDLLASSKANETRLLSASELKRRQRGEFGASLVRQALYGVYLTIEREDARDGLSWLKTEVPDYWANREKLVHILEYLAVLGNVSTMPHWRADGAAAGVLAGAVRNDHI